MTTPRRARTFHHPRKIDLPPLNLRSNVEERMKRLEQQPRHRMTRSFRTITETRMESMGKRMDNSMMDKMGMDRSTIRRKDRTANKMMDNMMGKMMGRMMAMGKSMTKRMVSSKMNTEQSKLYWQVIPWRHKL